MKQIIVILISMLFLMAACCEESVAQKERPLDPWVFRSVLDKTPRIITLALNEDLWAAYNTQSGALYKVWDGRVEFDGAVYTTSHGPQPTSVGDSWYRNEIPSPWMFSRNGETVTPEFQYRGHRFGDHRVVMHYEFTLEDGSMVSVFESPEHVVSDSGQIGFERWFTTDDMPADLQIALKINLSSLASQSDIVTDGDFNIENSSTQEMGGISGMDVSGTLALKSNATTRFTTYFTEKPMVSELGEDAKELVDLHPGAKVIAQSDCKVCHNPVRRTIGPSYLEIARKYFTTEASKTHLVDKIKNGGSGIWGDVPMSPHLDLSDSDLDAIVAYILSLDQEEEDELLAMESASSADADYRPAATRDVEANLIPGGYIEHYFAPDGVEFERLDDVDYDGHSIWRSIRNSVGFDEGAYHWLEMDLAIQYSGYYYIPTNGEYTFKLSSSDGARLFLGDSLIANNDGIHEMSSVETSQKLAKGFHPFTLQWFYGGTSKKGLNITWKGLGQDGYSPIPENAIFHHRLMQGPGAGDTELARTRKIPGDGFPLWEMHPSYDLTQARPDWFTPKVAGMDFLSDGRMIVSTWDPAGSVYLIDGVDSGDPEAMTVTPIARGLAEPLGLKIVNDEIYVLQKQELTKLIDHDGDMIIDEYYTFANDWTTSANFHEFAFGLAEKDNHLYFALAIAIEPGGASTNPQRADRGKVTRVSLEDGSVDFVAHGLRTPNGIGEGVDGELFVSDNQGDWLPSSKVVHVQQDAWYGSRAVDFEATATMDETLPLVWLPQNEIGNSPSTPLYLNDGPYEGQMIHGEVTHGGVKRVFVEKVNGAYQGCLFRFMQGVEAGVNRLVWGPDGALYIGGIGNPGNWGHEGKLHHGLQRVIYNDNPTFEMLAVSARTDGVEITFTEPLQEGDGWLESDYAVQQWWYKPTENYGGPKLDEEELNIASVNVSEDRTKVFLELPGMKENHVVYVRLMNHFVSENNNELWTTEGWYTMNAIPDNKPGFRTEAPAAIAHNSLSDAEAAAGWKLLFDGTTTNGWRGFKKETVGSSWRAASGALEFDPTVKDGGDIITDGEYENFELKLEWKIADCGNSGIFYNVVESDQYDWVWQTGPEMQVLDNACHPDSEYPTHRAGDLYDMIACKFVTVHEAGAWNQVRIIINQGVVQHWLNGHKVVEFEMWTPEWDAMVAASKFHSMPGFGKAKSGHIALQDHSDRVWFRNIKIREL